jgi:hypothetical protein
MNGDHLAYVGLHYDVLKKVNYRNAKWFDAFLSSGLYVSDVFLGFRKVPHFVIAVLVREKTAAGFCAPPLIQMSLTISSMPPKPAHRRCVPDQSGRFIADGAPLWW